MRTKTNRTQNRLACFSLFRWLSTLIMGFGFVYAQPSEKLAQAWKDSAKWLMNSVNNPDSALILGEKAIQEFESLGMQKPQIGLYSLKGAIFSGWGDSANAYQAFHKSLEMARAEADTHLVLECQLNLGNFYRNFDNPEAAIDLFLSSIREAEKLRDTMMIINANYYLSYIFARNNDLEKVEGYISEAIGLFEASREDISYDYMICGFYHLGAQSMLFRYQEDKKPEQARKFLRFAETGLSFALRFGLKMDESAFYRMLGDYYREENDIPKASKYFEKLLSLKAFMDRVTLASIYVAMIEINLQQADNLAAVKYLDLWKESGSFEPINDLDGKVVYNLAARASKAGGRTSESLEYLEKSIACERRLFDEEQTRITGELNARYQTEKKDLMLRNKELENVNIRAKNRAIVAWGGGGTGILLLFASLIFFRSKNKRLLAELQLAETSILLHRSQLNPHFIFNSINSIYPFLYDKTDPNRAADYLSNLSMLIRNMLESTFESSWSLGEEIDFIRRYCNIQQLKIGDRVKLEVEVPEGLKSIKIPSLITQTFIENAFLHGLGTHQEQMILKVVAEERKNGIQIQILDNGVGNPGASEGHKSRSFEIVHMRIMSTYAGKNLMPDFLTYGKQTIGYKVQLHLPATS